MISQVIKLCRLQLANLFGINEFRYTKDKSKKARSTGLAVVWVLLIIMVIGYVGTFAYGLILFEMEDIVPMYLYAVASLLILIFSFFKAGSVLFSMKGYEMLVSLPVSKAAIVISRFCCMYVTNLLAGLLIMLPGMAVYGYFVRPTAWFYVIFLLGTIFLPLFPLTISSILGAGITAISARTKHKSLAETLFMLAVIIGIMAGSMLLSEKEEMLTTDFLKNMAEVLSAQIGRTYPPAIWFGNALSGDFGALVLLIVIPTVIFVIFIAILQKYFQSICMAIHTVSAKNNYKMANLQVNGQVVALWKRELKRYFSSSVYVTNTIVGYVMAVIVAIGIFFVGMDEIENVLAVSNIEQIFTKCMPYGLACLITLTSITSCSISLEGNTLWQIQTLPVSAKQVYDSKILANLTVAAPFYLISVLFLSMSVDMSLLELFWLIVIPAAYLVFMCVAGITANLAFPVFDWENEVRVVKQSASMLVTMLTGMVSSILPFAGMVFIEERFSNIINIVVLLVLATITSVLYIRNNKKELKSDR